MQQETFRLEIKTITKEQIALEVESQGNISTEEIGEILLTAFKELEHKNELLLRLILFSSFESLAGNQEIMLVIRQYLDEYYPEN